MAKSDSPKIYAGMLKTELLEVADRLGLRGVKKMRKTELLQMIQGVLRRPKREAPPAKEPSASAPPTPSGTESAKGHQTHRSPHRQRKCVPDFPAFSPRWRPAWAHV